MVFPLCCASLPPPLNFVGFFPKKYQALGKSATGQAKDKQVPSVFEKQMFGRVLSWDRQGQLKACLFNMGLFGTPVFLILLRLTFPKFWQLGCCLSPKLMIEV
jgi:hypothetical protein